MHQLRFAPGCDFGEAQLLRFHRPRLDSQGYAVLATDPKYSGVQLEVEENPILHPDCLVD